VEAAPRLDRSADDDQLSAPLGGDSRDLLAEAPGTSTDDLAAHGDAVRARNRRCRLEPLSQTDELSVEVRVQRQLALEDGRSDEDDARSAIGGEPAREVEGMLRLFAVEQRHDDAAVSDRAGPAREASRPAMKEPDVGQLHRMS
jgi:hypothetical protein